MEEINDRSFEDYLNRINIQEVLQHAGYVLNKRDGLRYPSYVRLDDDGRRIHGDKFIVTPDGNRCFKPPVMQTYNVVSFIRDHTDLFAESAGISNPYHVVHEVCRNILNMPKDERSQKVLEPRKEVKPFTLDDYSLHTFRKYDYESQKKFFPFFVNRGINLATQRAFALHFMLASREVEGKDGNEPKVFTNLSFPLTIPGEKGTVGFEERGYPRLDGSSGYKGKALGSNSSEGLWIANLGKEELKDARHVYWFESAYDAMAYYQLNHDSKDVRNAVFVSTGGNPAYYQMERMLKEAPEATHHIAFDNDPAGNQFLANFRNISEDVERQLNKGKEDGHLKDLGTYDVPEWALNLLENGEADGLTDDEIEVAEKFIKEHFPEGFLMNVDWEDYNDFNRYPSFGTRNENALTNRGEAPYLAVKTYSVQFMHPTRREGQTEISIEREVPPNGIKDWNDVILMQIRERKMAEEEEQPEEKKVAAGIDLDGNGEVEVLESEEKKHYHVHGR